jgi:putative nucleotidyltransferase with HDIG domain
MTNDTAQLREGLLERAGLVKTLPMLTSMMNEVFRIMANPDSSFGQLYDVVKYDQAISSRIISIANSSYYNRGTQVTNLERAMVMVGFKEVERIIMCLVFMKQIMAPWSLGQNDMAAIWEHSLTVAHAARTLSAKTATENPEKVFAISILHDIGKVIFYASDDRYRYLANEALLDARGVCDLERAEYGIDHQEIGHHMSVKWGFPEEFSEAILKHHSPHDGRVPIIDIVRDADAFACGQENALPEKERTALQLEKEAIKAETERVKLLVGA